MLGLNQHVAQCPAISMHRINWKPLPSCSYHSLTGRLLKEWGSPAQVPQGLVLYPETQTLFSYTQPFCKSWRSRACRKKENEYLRRCLRQNIQSLWTDKERQEPGQRLFCGYLKEIRMVRSGGVGRAELRPDYLVSCLESNQSLLC